MKSLFIKYDNEIYKVSEDLALRIKDYWGILDILEEEQQEYVELSLSKAYDLVPDMKLDDVYDDTLTELKDYDKKTLSQKSKAYEKVCKLVSELELDNIEILINEIKKETKLLKTDIKNNIILYRKQRAENIKEALKPPKMVDERFNSPDLLIHLFDEMKKRHVGDEIPKFILTLAGASSELPKAEDHVSIRVNGDSSEGKSNLIREVILRNFPSETTHYVTRQTEANLEDTIGDKKRIVLLELNIYRDGGSNKHIVETFKQLIEDGLDIKKNDAITNEPKHIVKEKISGFWGTTDIQEDDELDTRKFDVTLTSDFEKNKAVVENFLDTINKDYESVKQTWFAKSILGLENYNVYIPYNDELKQIFKSSYTKGRIKRDSKKYVSLAKAFTFLFQKQRRTIEINGKKLLLSEPQDFILSYLISYEELDYLNTGLNKRLVVMLDYIRDNRSKLNEHDKERLAKIKAKNEYLDLDNHEWVFRDTMQKDLAINSLNTIKTYLKELKDLGKVEQYFDENIPLGVLVKLKEGVKEGVKGGVKGINIDRLDTLNDTLLNCKNKYVELLNDGKFEFSPVNLKINGDEFFFDGKKVNLTPSKLTPSNSTLSANKKLAIKTKDYLLQNYNPKEEEIIQHIGEQGYKYLSERKCFAFEKGSVVATDELKRLADET